MTTWHTGPEAAAQRGKTVAEIDAAAARGEIPAKYVGWRLLIKPEPKKKRATKTPP